MAYRARKEGLTVSTEQSNDVQPPPEQGGSVWNCRQSEI